MYAIIETGGKQIRVEEGSVIYVEKLDAEVDSEVVFDKVVLLSGKTTKVGAPYVKGLKLLLLSKNKVEVRRSEFSSIKLKKVLLADARAIVSHILNAQSKLLKLKYGEG